MYSICIFLQYMINIEVIYVYNSTLNAKTVGNVIAEFRKNKGISQEVLSGLADIGRTHLSAIERGERKPTLETLYRISTALDVKMSDIVNEIENEISKQDVKSNIFK